MSSSACAISTRVLAFCFRTAYLASTSAFISASRSNSHDIEPNPVLLALVKVPDNHSSGLSTGHIPLSEKIFTYHAHEFMVIRQLFNQHL